MKTRHLLLSALMLCACTALWGAGPAAVRAAKAPSIDGKLDEAVWAAAPAYTAFVTTKGRRPAVNPTSVKCLFDDRNLYFGITCAIADGGRPAQAAARPRDGGLYQLEGIELMLDPGRNQDFYYHFMVSSNGDLADRTCEQGGILGAEQWNGQWTAKVAWQKNAYTVEIAIPLYNFAAVRAKAPVGWAINVCRNARPPKAGNEDASIANGNYNTGGAFLPLDGIDLDLRNLQFSFDRAAASSAPVPGAKIHTTPSVAFANATGRPLRGAVEAWIRRESDRKYTFNVKKRFDLADGANARLELNPITHEGEGDYFLFVRAEDENGRAIAYTDQKISVRLAPLAIDLEVPWYRNSIFASQKLTEVRFTVKCSLPADQAKGSSITAEILDDATKKTVWTATRPAAAKIPFSLATAKLPDGRYTLKATLVKGGKPVPFGSTSTFLWKLPHKDTEAWMDRHGNWFIDGKPFTINTGWFGSAKDYGPHINLVMAFDFRRPAAPFENAKILDTNLMWGSGRVMRRPERQKMLQQATIPPEFAKDIRDLITKARDQKNLFCYYLIDEPSGNSVHPSALRQIYEIIRETDPYHPVMQSDSTTHYNYIDCADLNIHHPYPRILDNLKYNDCTRIVNDLRRGQEKQAALGHKSSFLFMRMGFNQLDYGYGPANSRIISYEELRDQVIMAFAAGIKAMCPYDRSINGYPESQIGYRASDIEAAWLLHVINTPPSPVKAASPKKEMIFTVHDYQGATYVLASNVSMDEGRYEFTLQGLPASVKSLVVIGEERTVPVRNGKVVDDFHPCGGHVYTTGKDPGFEPVASIRRRIEAEWQKRQKPGNLFFERQTDRAVHIRVSSDAKHGQNRQTVRWHLCDGLETGATWDKAYQFFFWTPAPSPDGAWVEFTPVKPAVIGRVAVYSDDISLKDYDVQVFEDGAWKTVASVKGATTERTEVSFAPRTVTKLRLFLPAWPNPKQPPHIAEVEAYAK